MVTDTHSVFREFTNPQNTHFGVQDVRTELCGTVDAWMALSFLTFFLEIQKLKTLRKAEKTARVWHFRRLGQIRWKTWMIIAVPNFKNCLILKQMKKSGFAGITHSDTKPHFTVHNATKDCLVTGQCCIGVC